MTERIAVYDTGMLIAIASRKATAVQIHREIRDRASHRPIVPGLALIQAWRPEPGLAHTLSTLLKDCTVPHARSSSPPFRRTDAGRHDCIACSTAPDVRDLRRIGAALGTADFPSKKRPDAVDASVAWIAMKHRESLLLTSDPRDMTAYLAALHDHDTRVVAV
ncbi:hypothetical protein [Streptomonospora litoralis]|uniref:PIN domain-containing protein n=1 Tax=Streptomonospora litoralis TaxID=2498135 RepID=A0A4P6Q8I2_9ACTN|nr:hypothetical protein [Streptomonospora litoralis]QBI55801.1 hypothetical protein EKD16_20190 [Streptomonospora litoralis]